MQQILTPDKANAAYVAAMTIPMSYRGADGRQYVAVFATGSAFDPPVRGADGRPANNEQLITWALPE